MHVENCIVHNASAIYLTICFPKSDACPLMFFGIVLFFFFLGLLSVFLQILFLMFVVVVAHLLIGLFMFLYILSFRF